MNKMRITEAIIPQVLMEYRDERKNDSTKEILQFVRYSLDGGFPHRR